MKQLFYAVVEDPGDKIEDPSTQLFIGPEGAEEAEKELRKRNWGSIVCFFVELGDPYELVRIPRWYGYGDSPPAEYFCKCPRKVSFAPAVCEDCERTAGRFNPDQEV
jgi:hypothetical protein